MKRVLLFAFGLFLLQFSAAAAAEDDALLRAREGAANLLRGKYAEAIAAFDAALQAGDLADVRRANMLNDRGVAKWRLNRPADAIADFNKSIELFPDYAIVYNNRGNALADLGELDQAVLDFTRAVDLAPGYGAAYNNRGNAYLALGRREEALEDFRKAVELMPTNAVPFNGRGKTHKALGRPFAGMRDFSKALTLNAKYTDARRNRGAIYLDLGRETDAVQDYTELVAQEPEKAEFYLARGTAYARSNHYNAAVRDLSKAISLDPDLAAAYRERGATYIRARLFDKARDDLSTALSLRPDDVAALVDRAQVLLRFGLAEEGLVDADKALSIEPRNAAALTIRGRVYEALGRPDEAISDYKDALNVDAGHAAARLQLQNLGVTSPPASEPEAVGEPVAGWEIRQLPEGHYEATNSRYPKMRVRLEMHGPGTPEILDWTLMKHSLRGIGLLRYRAGRMEEGNKGEGYVYTAILDLWKSQLVAIEPHAWGDDKARWEWKMASVSVTDPAGVVNEVTLRKAPSDSYGDGDQHWSNDGWWSQGQRPYGRSAPRQRQPQGGGGLFDWLFR